MEDKRRMQERIFLQEKKCKEAEFEYLVLLTEVQELRKQLIKQNTEIEK
jgi:hypothetical protein